MKIRARVVEGIVVLVVLTGLILSASSAGGPSLPLFLYLYGDVSYEDGSLAPNVGVNAKNEVSGQSLATTTDEKGVWSLEVSEIASCGGVVLIVAKDAWDNEVSEKVNVSEAPQRIDLKFDVPPPTTTPPFIGDGDNNEEGEIPSGTQNETEQSTETVTPTPTATPTSSPTVTFPSGTELNTSQSNFEPDENASPSIFSHKGSKPSMAVVSAVIALVAGLAFVTLLIYRRKNKKV